jgi:hypothetical protein
LALFIVWAKYCLGFIVFHNIDSIDIFISELEQVLLVNELHFVGDIMWTYFICLE